jgi:transcriptional regulator
VYVPTRYLVLDDPTIDAFLRAHGFATVVTVAPGGEPSATHLPIELVHGADGERTLEGHFARTNPHWKSIDPEARALVVFTGPHTYVSASWYDHENVPTWNYQAVHCSGPIELVHEPAELLAMVRRLALHYEPDGPAGVGFDVDRMTSRFRDAELKGIVGFRIRVEKVEAAFKLSQNRDQANRERVVAKLRERTDDHSRAIADAMERLPPAR